GEQNQFLALSTQANRGTSVQVGVPGIRLRVTVDGIQPIGRAGVGGDRRYTIADNLCAAGESGPQRDWLPHMSVVRVVRIEVDDCGAIGGVDVQRRAVRDNRITLIDEGRLDRLWFKGRVNDPFGYGEPHDIGLIRTEKQIKMSVNCDLCTQLA